MNFIESLSLAGFAYTVVGLAFMLGAGGVLFAFALSYISQKVAMWIDVRKIVMHRNGLIEQVKALKVQIETLESLPDNQDAGRVVAPTEIGVQSVPIGAP